MPTRAPTCWWNVGSMKDQPNATMATFCDRRSKERIGSGPLATGSKQLRPDGSMVSSVHAMLNSQFELMGLGQR